MFALIKEVNTTIKLLITMVKLLNQSLYSEFKDFTKLLVLETKLHLARIHNARKGV